MKKLSVEQMEVVNGGDAAPISPETISMWTILLIVLVTVVILM